MYGVFTPAKVSPDIVRRLSEVMGWVGLWLCMPFNE